MTTMYAIQKDDILVTQRELYEANDGYDVREKLLNLDSPILSKSKKKLQSLIETSEFEYCISGGVKIVEVQIRSVK